MDQTAQSWWFIFYKDQLLLEKKGDGKYAVPYGESSPIIMKEKTTVHKEHLIESVSFYRYEKGKKGWRRTAIR